jgi:hypothetical protein
MFGSDWAWKALRQTSGRISPRRLMVETRFMAKASPTIARMTVLGVVMMLRKLLRWLRKLLHGKELN